jgi:hypothetical protein
MFKFSEEPKRATGTGQSANDEALFFSRCIATKHNKFCTTGRFKSRFDRAICCLMISLVAVLLAGVIIPMVMNDIINDQISKATVIDSTSADSYEAWSTNTVRAIDSVSFGVILCSLF